MLVGREGTSHLISKWESLSRSFDVRKRRSLACALSCAREVGIVGRRRGGKVLVCVWGGVKAVAAALRHHFSLQMALFSPNRVRLGVFPVPQSILLAHFA